MAGSIAAGNSPERTQRKTRERDCNLCALCGLLLYTRVASKAGSVRVPLVLLLFVSSAMAQTTPQTSSQATSHFAQLADEFMKATLALSPTNASQAGYHKHVENGRTRELDA